LLNAGRQLRPFVSRKDAGNDIERNQPLGASVFAVDRERDTETVKESVRFSALLR
jgi:hypothetical protein